MLSQEIRRNFLKFFKDKGHNIVPSSPVVPHDDPTLLFVNAGMNQFKDVFLGKVKRGYTRAATSQKCIRVGGKHNDLENVGHTSRHLTFFEMLGNFSFGDYFKKEAIDYGFEVATSIFGLDPKKIFATVFKEDDEAFELWKKYLPDEQIVRMGEESNFWAMGDIGPCGPCSELLYDRGPSWGNARNPAEDVDGERFFEFWNLVFMQYNRTSPSSLEPLPKQSVDTGSGLERVALLKLGVKTIFETDILREIIAEIENLIGQKYDPKNSEKSAPFNVIADHLRTLSFAISDGVQPSNIERGYVLRKVLRRSVRYGRALGFEKPFHAKLLPRLISLMGEDYPELIESKDRIAEILTLEEENFLKTLQRGGNIMNQIIQTAHLHGNQISGDDAFKLKDTYGLPFEEIHLLAKDASLTVDVSRFETLEKEAKERSRSLKKGGQGIVESQLANLFEKHGATKFVGFDKDESHATILSVLKDNVEVDSLRSGDVGAILLDVTPFYSEKGGQIGDTGTLSSEKGEFSVSDTKSPINELIFHYGKVVKGEMKKGDRLKASIDRQRREKIANNHTATHLLHWALQQVLGPHIKQAGSLVEPTRLRFDFNHHKSLSLEELTQIEELVNKKVRENTPVTIYEITYEEAIKQKEIKQFFGDKYGDEVRVIDINYSKELCGGSHTKSTGHIGYFRIFKESSIASGVRRIEAMTGEEADHFARSFEEKIGVIGTLLNVQEGQLLEKVKTLVNEKEKLEKETKELRRELYLAECDALLEHLDKDFIVKEVPLATKELKEFSDLLFERKKTLAIFLVTEDGSLFSRISKDLNQKGLRADAWVKEVSQKLEGKGGGSGEMAQGRVSSDKKERALTLAQSWIQNI